MLIDRKISKRDSCRIHRSHFSRGREQAQTERRSRLSVQRIEDPYHPREYRELRSQAEMRKLLNRKSVEQDGTCAICHELFTDCSEIVPYADIGIRDGMPTFRICRFTPCARLVRWSARRTCRHIQSASRNVRSASGGR